MTWTLRVRGTGGPVVAEYRCPVHGIVEVTVDRNDQGDPPPVAYCPVGIDPDRMTTCGHASQWTISTAPALRFPRATFFRGKSERRGNPLDIDTRPLAEGMPLDEWKANRAKVWQDHDYKQWKDSK